MGRQAGTVHRPDRAAAPGAEGTGPLRVHRGRRDGDGRHGAPGLRPSRHREGHRAAELDPEPVSARSASAASARTPTPSPTRRAWSSWPRSRRRRAPRPSAQLVAGLERIHSHLLWLGVAAHEAGFDTLFMYTWRDRETVMDMLEQMTGNRVNYSANVLGGVKCDVTAAHAAAIRRGDGLPRGAHEALPRGGAPPTRSFLRPHAGIGS